MNDRTPAPRGLEDRARIAAEDQAVDWRALENLIHIDPAGRGLASFMTGSGESCARLDAGQLRAAANHLASNASAIGIITGFCAVTRDRVTAETDGPPGALLLARVLLAAGTDVSLISDSYGVPLLAAGCELFELDRQMVIEFPMDIAGPAEDAWLRDFFARGPGGRLTHLIAIERPGPSHTLESLEKQSPAGSNAREQFLRAVNRPDRDLCHNMRGESIEGWTARTHRLFEWIDERQLPVTTIAVGDGGNEIGMGRFPWNTIVEAIGSDAAGKIVCRIATEYAIVGGVSDWAAYALALAVARLRGVADRHEAWTANAQSQLIEHLVARAGAVDGITRLPNPTVDGLPLDVYLEPLTAMRKLLGFER